MNLILSGICLAAAVVATNSADVVATGPCDAVEPPAKSNRVAKITAASTYYDSKDGVAYFAGNVCVDDEEYQLHADRAYVFMDRTGTNDLKRIVAIGNVALTNDTKRAYGDKVSYHRAEDMVVLYAPTNGCRYCEVRDEKTDPPQSVKGEKIKFWIGSEQIQVEKAVINAPVTGADVQGFESLTGGK